MTTEIETQNLAIARTFVMDLLGQANTSLADEMFAENTQGVTGLKPDAPINGREEYKQILSAFFDAFPMFLPL